MTVAQRVLFCGSRNWSGIGHDGGAAEIIARVGELPEGTLVIHGGARGADAQADHAARSRGLHVARIDALWRVRGKFNPRAGHIRNSVMLDLAPDLVIAFQRNGSSGTQGTINEARRRGIPVEVHTA